MKQMKILSAVMGGLLSVGAGSASANAQTANSTSTPQQPMVTEAVGKSAGTFMVGVRALGIIPENNGSSTSIGGHVSATGQAAPELNISYFFTDNIAAEIIAASTRHNIRLGDTALGGVDAGSAWVLPPTLTLQYHFFPHEKFSPYIGVGVNATFFYATSGSGPLVSKLTLDNRIGGVFEAGLDYNIVGHWFANFDVKQILVSTRAHADTALGPVTAKTDLDPLVIGAGIAYRF